jgi:catalase-peroxidase
MAMNDEETVALIAGGHTFGKAHGAANPDRNVGPEPEAAPIEQMGLGWKNGHGSGSGGDAISSGLEGAWTANPIAWDNGFFENLFSFEWELTTSPAGAKQWAPTDPAAADQVPDAHDASKRHAPMMLTADLALRVDPIYERISRHFYENPQEFAAAFARAWFKLTHRDMGPRPRYLGALVPAEQLIWQDPVPAATHEPIGAADIAALKAKVLGSGLTVSELVGTAWASASTFRTTDKRGGANGARLRLEPQKGWEVNDPAQLDKVLTTLERVRLEFGKQVSLADLIVLAGSAAVEKAAKDAGFDIEVPFTPGRTDASQEQTDVESFAVLEPTFDGFRNYIAKGHNRPTEQLLVEKAQSLTLSAPEMTVLVGGLRALDANAGHAQHGVLTSRPGTLTNDFFVNLLEFGTTWTPTTDEEELFEGKDDATGETKWTATRADLIFGSNSVLRATAEVYASDDAREKFARDFVAAWVKVMNLDRFDIA